MSGTNYKTTTTEWGETLEHDEDIVEVNCGPCILTEGYDQWTAAERKAENLRVERTDEPCTSETCSPYEKGDDKLLAKFDRKMGLEG